MNIVVSGQALDAATRTRITHLDVMVSGAETFAKTIGAAVLQNSELHTRYIPAVKSGTLDIAFLARDDVSDLLAVGSVSGVSIAASGATTATIALSPSLGTGSKGEGEPCSTSDECGTAGGCVDGVCCRTACDGQCQACNVDGSPGVCSAVTGTPRGARQPCAGVGTACVGTCDGTDELSCTYPTSAALCGASCDGQCDGQGGCTSSTGGTCPSGFACGSSGCLTACSNDGQCQSGYKCVAPNCVAQCQDGAKDGMETDVDCGGPTCPACVVTRHCSGNGDCQSGICTSAFCIPATGPPNWLPAADMMTARGYLSAATAPDGRIFAISGYTATTTVEAYTPDTDSWAAAPSLINPHPRAAAVQGPDGKIYVIGGATNTVETYTVGASSWVAAPTMAQIRSGVAAARGMDGTIYAIGGYQVASSVVFLKSVESLTPGASAWVSAPDLTRARGQLGAALGSDGHVYAFGGDDNSGMIMPTEMLNGAVWTATTSTPTATSLFGYVAAPDGRIYLLGNGAATQTVQTYSPATDKWLTVAPLTNARTAAAGAVGLDGRIYAIGGEVGGTEIKKVEVYGPTVALSAGSGNVGSSIVVMGSNFAANATVRVYFDTTTGLPLGSGMTDAAGALTGAITVQVPSTSAGAHSLIVVDNRSSYPITKAFSVN